MRQPGTEESRANQTLGEQCRGGREGHKDNDRGDEMQWKHQS